MVTIVFTHPWHGSFNKAILDTIISKYDNENKAYKVIDLPKDNFNPCFTEAEMAVYNKGQALDPLVVAYQEQLKKSDEIIFIFPIWWGTMPAILKGFFDKVLLVNFSHNYENGWTPLLGNIKKASIFTTSQSPTAAFEHSIVGNFVPSMLNSIGITNTHWLNCDETSSGTEAHRKAYLKQVEDNI